MQILRVGLFILSLCVCLTAHASPRVGDKLSSEIKVETDIGIKRIPLPNGEWTTVSTRNLPSTPTFGGSEANKFTELIFAKSHNGIMTHLLYVYLNTTSGVSRYSNELCKKKVEGRFYENKYLADVWEQACLEVHHSAEFLVVSSADKAPWSNVRTELRRSGISYPSSLLNIRYRRYDEKGQWLTYRLSINPMTFGFPDFNGKWANSPWHKDFLGRDSRRMSLMNSVLQAALEIRRTLDWHFMNSTERSPNIAFPLGYESD